MRFLLSIIITSLLLAAPSHAQLFRRLVNPQQQQMQFLRQQQLRKQIEARRIAAEKAAAKAREAAKKKAQVAESRKGAKSQKKAAKPDQVVERSKGKSTKKTVQKKQPDAMPGETSETSIADIPKEMMGPKTLHHKGFGMTLKLIKGKVVVAATSRKGMASESGVLKGDILASVGSMPIQFPQDISGFDKVLSPGDMLDFVLVRKGKKKSLVVPYKKKPVEEGTIVEGTVAQNKKRERPGRDAQKKLEPIASTTPTPATPEGEPTPAVRMDDLSDRSGIGLPLDLETLLNDTTPQKRITPPKPPANESRYFSLPDTGEKLPNANRLINNEISELQSLIEEHKLMIRSAERRLQALMKNVKAK